MKHVIGVDLGGTKISASVVNDQASLIRSAVVATGAADGPQAVIGRMADLIADLMRGHDVQAIGVGTPGYVDVNRGKVLFVSDNLPGWSGMELKQELSRRFGVPVVVENDANCAALCESWVGAGRDLDNFLMITLGTGVGGALYTRKTGIWHGHSWRGAEIGHFILYPGGIPCNCGQIGCVDQYISGTAVQNAYQRSTGASLDAKSVFDAAEAGDLVCSQIIERFAYDLAIFLTTLKNILDPQAFLVGGGLIYARHLWWDRVRMHLAANCIGGDRTIMLPAQYLNDAGRIGAAKVALEAIG
ncbi:MAG: ROK family protein [Bacillota bacterium]